MRNPYSSDRRIRIMLSLVMLLFPVLLNAETLVPVKESMSLVTIFMFVIIGFILLILLYLVYVIMLLLEAGKPVEQRQPLFAGLVKRLTDTVPVEHEATILTDHVYDGIQELDNNLPPWWKYMFYATIVFAVVYMYYYHFNENGLLQIQEYEQELVIAEQEKTEYMKHAANSIDESNAKLSDAKGIVNGKAIYLQNCSACHGKLGEGGVGPNLTDEYWLHGGNIKNVFTTIKYGVPQNGMISWKAQMSPLHMQDVASYILSLKGSKPTNGKAPQGEKYEEKKEIAAK